MKKNFSIITLGTILEQIRQEGLNKGQDWDVKRLYVTRNEASPKNIREYLAKHPTEKNPESKFLFPFYSNIEGRWRVYSNSEAEDLVRRIKEARKYTD